MLGWGSHRPLQPELRQIVRYFLWQMPSRPFAVHRNALISDGLLLAVTEDSDPELMTGVRSSYGMLGIIYEATYEVKLIVALAVEHKAYHVKDFVEQMETLLPPRSSRSPLAVKRLMR